MKAEMEVKTIIANKNAVKKVGQKEGKTIQIGNARLTWKAMGVDTAYGTSLYEMDLAPGIGIPVHSHPYAEVFYVISGHVDFLRYNEDGAEEWVRCGPGDILIAGANALHAFHNRTDNPSRFLSTSVYYHEVALEKYGTSVDVNAPAPANGTPTEAEANQYLDVLKDAMSVHLYFPQQNARNGLEVFRDIENRNKKAEVIRR
jgi:quercetin dioxygenase-like cupin family protein